MYNEHIMKRIFALIDCNNFYVSCERIFRPDLINKPVIILSNNDGCVVSRSNEVKKLGLISTGKPFYKCADAVKKHNIAVFSSNYALYGDISARVMKILSSFTLEMEIYSIDEAFIVIQKYDCKNVTEYGKKIKNTIRQYTGVPVSIGIGPTKTLAKIASRVAKKNSSYEGVFDITDHPKTDFILSGMKVADVWGIGRQYNKLLLRNNIKTVLQLKNLDDTWAKKNMTILGLYMVWELRGFSCITLELVPNPKKQILCSRSFGTPIEKLPELKEALSFHMTRACEKLRNQNCLTQVVFVFITTNPYKIDDPQYANSFLTELHTPTAYTPKLIEYAHKALEKIYKPGYKFKKAGILLAELVSEQNVQYDLFIPTYLDSKKQLLMKAVDKINKNWGNFTIRTASEGTEYTWGMKQSKKSNRYTTCWNEIPIVRV